MADIEYIDDIQDPLAEYSYSGYKDSLRTEQSYPYRGSEPNFHLPLIKHKNNQPYESPEEDVSIRKYLGGSVGLVSLLAENLLSHPFVVLRRQCQVNHSSIKYHLQPFTLIPVIAHLHRRQGVTTLWKGLGSCFLVRGMSLAVEDLISKLTPWPKDVNNKTSLKQFGQHILLKWFENLHENAFVFLLFFLNSISISVVMPFYSASLVETVQSDIASEKPGLFDVFREGANRLLAWSAPQKGRMLPVWVLIGPSVSLGITKYIFGVIVKGITTRILRYKWGGGKERDNDAGITISQSIELYSTLTSVATSEILFYPFETILHRLQLQGTRTIIDSLDNGYAVVPILTSYEGAIDCYRTTIASEGAAGLYKGFGAMALQLAAHIAIIKITKWTITQIFEIVSSKPPSRVVQYYHLDRVNTSNTTTASRSLSSLSGTE